MSKYDPLWKYIKKNGKPAFTLSFNEIKGIIGFEIDHFFLNCKKELIQYGFKVGKISLKDKMVFFEKMS